MPELDSDDDEDRQVERRLHAAGPLRSAWGHVSVSD